MKKSVSKAMALILLTFSMTLAACSDQSEASLEEDITTVSVSESAAAEEKASESNVSENTNAAQTSTSTDENTPFGRHGKLSVNGTDLVDKNGEQYQLYGMSTHGIAWYPQYVSYVSFMTLRDMWNTNCIRLAMYTDENLGYCSNGDKEELKALIRSGVEYADRLGMYVIIDWHILNDHDPNVYKDEALDFFREMTELYKDHDNIIYEICNEPNTSAEWSDVKSYAEEVIPVIRGNDSDAVVIVGTPTWCQDIDKALADPLDFDNVMYSLHFYAETHKDWLRDRMESCIESGLPVFISEFNICNASGQGNVNTEEGEKWYELIEKYNLSYMCWSLANNSDSCCVFYADNPKLASWTEDDLSASGKWVVEKFKSEENP